MSANDTQIGGDHYKQGGEEHWDRMWRMHGRGYFVGCITKYVERYHLKNGKQDLEKAVHYIEKLMELEYPEQTAREKLEAAWAERTIKLARAMKEDLAEQMYDHSKDASDSLSYAFYTQHPMPEQRDEFWETDLNQLTPDLAEGINKKVEEPDSEKLSRVMKELEELKGRQVNVRSKSTCTCGAKEIHPDAICKPSCESVQGAEPGEGYVNQG